MRSFAHLLAEISATYHYTKLDSYNVLDLRWLGKYCTNVAQTTSTSHQSGIGDTRRSSTNGLDSREPTEQS